VSLSVLVVDDEPMTRNLLRMILSHAGYAIYEAEDGLDALEKIKDLAPDLVVLDVMMPIMDGIDVCKAVRGDAATADLPIIMLSAYANSGVVEDSMKAGANRYLTKPISRKKLLEEVRELLEAAAVTQNGP
jgi:CheY-like chemotaxis protein